MIGSRFGDIFRGNSGKSGLLIAVVDQKIIEELWDFVEEHPAAPITVDLVSRQITADGFHTEFEIDDYTRWRLLEGLDDIGLTLRHVDQIDEFERRRAGYQAENPAGEGCEQQLAAPDRAVFLTTHQNVRPR